MTFIVPTFGRPSLTRALGSLQAQNDPNWNAVVCGDGVDPTEHCPDDPRMAIIQAPRTRSAGLTRNYAYAPILDDAGWLAFLDDDDAVTADYVELLRNDGTGADVVVFRMRDPRLGVLPDRIEPRIAWGHVGISFAVRASFICDHDLRFVREQISGPHQIVNEDIEFLHAALGCNARLLIHPRVAYVVRPDQGPRDA